VNLAAMMRLMIEKVTDSDWRLLDALTALVVRVRKRSGQEASIQARKEHFDACVLFDSGGPQSSEVVEQNRVQDGCGRVRASLKSRHPYPVCKQKMV